MCPNHVSAATATTTPTAILDTLAGLKMAYPTTTARRHRELESFRSQL
jgi:hypothetical protein